MSTPTDTPRTDAVRDQHRGDTVALCTALIPHANTLERELAAATARAEKAEAELQRVDALIKEIEVSTQRVLADAQSSRWRGHELEQDLAKATARIAELEAANAKLREAAVPFVNFIEKLDAEPLKGIADDFYNIHTGTEWQASVRFSDMRKLRDAALAHKGVQAEAKTCGECAHYYAYRSACVNEQARPEKVAADRQACCQFEAREATPQPERPECFGVNAPCPPTPRATMQKRANAKLPPTRQRNKMTPIEDVKKHLQAQVNLGRSFMNASVEGDALDALAAIEALEAENALLREALGPFAAALPIYNSTGPHVWSDDIVVKHGITVGDLRRAAEAMKGGAK